MGYRVIASTGDVATRSFGRALGVPGHQVGDSRLIGGRPPSAL